MTNLRNPVDFKRSEVQSFSAKSLMQAPTYPFWVLFAVFMVLALGLYSEVGLKQFTTIVPDEASPIATLHKDLVWVLCACGLVIHCARNGLKYLGPTVAPITVMAVIGLVSSVFGIDPLGSIRAFLYWGLCLLGGAVVALETPPLRVRQLLFWILFAELITSVAVAVALPDLGRQIDVRSGDVWRGVYTNKNILGWMSVWALGAGWFFRRDVGRLAALGLGAVALLCLYKAHSEGSWVAVALTVGLLIMMSVVRRIWKTPATQATLTLLIAAVVALAGLALSKPLLALLGRDATLTGRTDVWRAFLDIAVHRWPIGFGPGSFTVSGPIVDEMAARFASTGALIRTPHNMYIAAFGESGIVGLFAYVGALFYIGFIEPFRKGRPAQLVAGAAAITILTGGLIETHEVYQAAVGVFVLFLLRGMGSAKHETSSIDEAPVDAPSVPERKLAGPRVLGGSPLEAPVAGRPLSGVR